MFLVVLDYNNEKLKILRMVLHVNKIPTFGFYTKQTFFFYFGLQLTQDIIQNVLTILLRLFLSSLKSLEDI
jgi:hypothetical protein